MILGYSVAIMIIGSVFYIIFTFFPGISGATALPSYSGFPGFQIVEQGYAPSASAFYIKFQNLLNENIKIDGLSMIVSGVNYTAFSCSKSYLPALEDNECNLSASLGDSFTAIVYIYYTPTNISYSPVIASRGSVTN